MKQVGLFIVAVAMALLAGSAGANCYTDTTQANFQAGVANSVDLTSSPGDVLLTSAAGSPAVDAQNTSITGNGELFSYTQWNAQTFTAGKSGPLSRVDVNLFCYFCGTAPPSIIVSIRATSNGVPTGGDLATATTVITNWQVGAQVWFTASFASPAIGCVSGSSGICHAVTIVVVDGTRGFGGVFGFEQAPWQRAASASAQTTRFTTTILEHVSDLRAAYRSAGLQPCQRPRRQP